MRAWIIALLLTSAGTAAQGHPLAPALLELRETGTEQGLAAVTWKTSSVRLPGAELQPRLPKACEAASRPQAVSEGASWIARWEVQCSRLVGERIGVAGLGAARVDALVRIEFADGRLVQRVVRAREPDFEIPERDRPRDVALSYGALGVYHIWLGADHLLFVFGLLLLVKRFSALVKTVTAFTLGHSVTLSLAALGAVTYPTQPIELLIAISVFVLACELARRQSRPTLMRRFPWVMAILFGLLHGLGFAGALAEAGLPRTEIPVALFSFNVGIELGQVAFIAGVELVRRALAVRIPFFPPWARVAPVYAMGILAAFWCFERAAALLP
jgi:hydrogenase/urease accessory protein HupE